MINLTKKEAAEKRRIDRKVLSRTATRKEVLRGMDLLQKARISPGSIAEDAFQKRKAFSDAVGKRITRNL